MYELRQVADNTFYINSPTNIGVWRVSDREVCLIDSGTGELCAGHIREILDGQGWHLRAIYNTHTHADHVGSNHYLQEAYGCPSYLPAGELPFAKEPLLEPAYLFGGFPLEDLCHKMLVPASYEAQLLTEQVLPAGFEVIPLPGHFMEMVGYRTPDDVVFLADAIMSEKTLNRARYPFLYDVAAHLETLSHIAQLQARLFIPAHVKPVEDIAPLAQANIDSTNRAADELCEICGEGTTFEGILQEVFNRHRLPMIIEQHALVGSTVRSYLAYLRHQGRLTFRVEDNLLLWARA